MQRLTVLLQMKMKRILVHKELNKWVVIYQDAPSNIIPISRFNTYIKQPR